MCVEVTDTIRDIQHIYNTVYELFVTFRSTFETQKQVVTRFFLDLILVVLAHIVEPFSTNIMMSFCYFLISKCSF